MKLYRIEQFKDGEWQVLEPENIPGLPFEMEGMSRSFAMGYMEGLKLARKILAQRKILVPELDEKNFRIVDVESGSEYDED